MRKFSHHIYPKLSYIIGFSLLLGSLSTQAAEYKKGIDYRVLPTQKSETPLVTEYFSFFCPHCFHFEKEMSAVKNALPSDVDFAKTPVSYMGGKMGPITIKA